MGSESQAPHLVIVSIEAWGHARPLCAFAAKVAMVADVHVTFFTPPRVLERVKAEFSRNFGSANADRQKFVRVTAVDNAVKLDGTPNMFEIMMAEHKRYVSETVAMYQRLLNEEPITCASTGKDHPIVAAPKMIVIDFMVGPLGRIIPTLPNNSSQVVAFNSGMISFGYLSFAPSERGGLGGLRSQILKIAAESGRQPAEVAEEILLEYTDDLVQIPGLPKMHHWEHDPQDIKFLLKGIFGGVWLGFSEAYETCDGMIFVSPEAYEPVAMAHTKEWLSDSGRHAWAIGPLLPPSASNEAIQGEASQSQDFAKIQQFMQDALSSHGECSMLYISFGSGFWPSSLEGLEAFVDVLLEKNVPFILSQGSPFAKLTDSLTAKIKKSGLGLTTRWAPQQTILAHPVLGWFVTHCGLGSILEAISSGVPMICWPFNADQPTNAVHLTVNHDVAYELLEVRTGNGLKTIYRTGITPAGTPDAIRTEVRSVLDAAFGKDGANKRENVRKLRDKIHAAWDKGGPADTEMVRFLEALSLGKASRELVL